MRELSCEKYERNVRGHRLIIMLFPYRPFNEFRQGCADVSAYYEVSNAAYKYAREMIGDLKSKGFEQADFLRSVPWKDILFAEKIAVKGRNSLAYTPEFGSFFAVMIIAVDGQPINIMKKTETDPACTGCGECIKACPVHAIGRDGPEPDRCLRQHMVGGRYSAEAALAAGKRLLGCDACQRACRKNEHIGAVDAPSEVQELFGMEALLDIADDDERLKKIGEYIGTNLARKRYLTALACVAAGNTGLIGEQRLRQLAEHEDERISHNAKIYLNDKK